MISGFKSLPPAGEPMAGLEPAIEGSLQISGWTHKPLCNQRPPKFKGSGGSSGRAVGYQVKGPRFESQSQPSQFFIGLLGPPSTKNGGRTAEKERKEKRKCQKDIELENLRFKAAGVKSDPWVSSTDGADALDKFPKWPNFVDGRDDLDSWPTHF
ncbi:hypothetical protein PoB_000544100 [Plakobranchus ocellatus]|uniref:Uncharacterized protein n=1 Tax=Plakobranchus ocellatus TaxID=259542 RepID=A0AAV3XVA6_9GAST|nr:hypothetical protein PoB_000544100 [Plakobranchus ocellatus]